MKHTGIVRRVDDLGRIVIPKAIRRTALILEGDPLEISVAESGAIGLTKYSFMCGIGHHSKQYAKSLSEMSDCEVLITDRNKVVQAIGVRCRELVGWRITKALSDNNDMPFQKQVYKDFLPVENMDELRAIVGVPVISDDEVAGYVVLLARNEQDEAGVVEEKLACTAAAFLGHLLNHY
jgi:AbrB family transcriptional regulator (stage V sporulation protein T)